MSTLDPAALRPMLAVAATQRLSRPDDAVEFKWDGIRALVTGDGNAAIVRSRRGADVTSSFPELAGLGQVLPATTVVDGEIVALDERGRPSFSRLQRRLGLRSPARVAAARQQVPVVMLLFDVLVLEGRMVIGLPWRQRRELLLGLELAESSWNVPPVGDDLDRVLSVAAERGLEGCILKDRASIYQPGIRSASWRKIRLVRRQELVVGGWKPSEGAMRDIGSLLVGYHDDRGLRWAGSVGSGITERDQERLRALLSPLVIDSSPFVDEIPLRSRVFVQPEVVVEVQFREWTPDGRLRQPSFKGLRVDIDPAEVRREPDPQG